MLRDRPPSDNGRNKHIRCIQTLIAFSVLLSGPLWAAQVGQRSSTSKSEPISVTADRLSVGEAGAQIEAEGNVEVKKQQTTLKAEEVRVNRTTQDVEAERNVSVDDPEWKINSADAVQLNLEKETGEFRNADIFIEQGHLSISGNRFQKFGGQTYHVDEGFFTTCLCESGWVPWRFSAGSMDLRPDGLGIIRGAYFYVFDIPVLYLPYAFFPLRSERQTGFLFPHWGSSTKEGFRFWQPFFWAISKSTDATVTFDLQTRARIGALAEFRTLFSRNSDFQIQSAYYNESLRKFPNLAVDQTIANPNIPQNRWAIIETHRYFLPGDWLTYSDVAAYRDDLFTRELIERFDLPGSVESDIRRSRYSPSRFGFYKGWRDTYFKGGWDFYQDFTQPDATTYQRTPEVTFWGRRFLENFPLEFRWQAAGVNYIRHRRGDGLRFDLRPELILPLRMPEYLFGSLSVAPRETLYHLYSPITSDRNISRELVEIRANIGTSISRIFAWQGTSLRGIKHVIEPEVSYLFIPRTSQGKIPLMDPIDRIEHRNVVTVALANRFWGKFVNPLAVLGSEKDPELLNPALPGTIRQMASLRLALSYDIERERNGGNNLSDIDMDLRLTPTGYTDIGFNAGLHPSRWDFSQARLTFNVSDPRPLPRRSPDPDFNRPSAISLSYSFLRRGPNGFLAEDANIDLEAPPNCGLHPDDPRCPATGFNKNIAGNLGGSLFYHLADNLLFNFDSTYDVRNNRFIGYRIGGKYLSSCECWNVTASLGRTVNPAKTTFNFQFNLVGLAGSRGGGLR